MTEADLAVDALLKLRLGQAFPEAGWLSEETADDADRLKRRMLVIVDPIDGTRAFVAGDPRWAVAAALVVDGRPVAGVVHAPALDETYAAARGAGAEFNGAAIAVAAWFDRSHLRAAGPKSVLQAMGARLGATIEIAPRVPSLAYRLCMAARGTIHFAVAAANAHDWDIAAADLLLEEAGARLAGASGERLVYNTCRTSVGAPCSRRRRRWRRNCWRPFASRPARDEKDPSGCRAPATCVFAALRAKPLGAPRVRISGETDDDVLQSESSRGGEAAAPASCVRRRTQVARQPTNSATRPRLDIVGLFPDYASAEQAWRAKAQQTVDSAQTRYYIVHLHRLIEPDLAPPTRTA